MMVKVRAKIRIAYKHRVYEQGDLIDMDENDYKSLSRLVTLAEKPVIKEKKEVTSGK